MDQIFNILITAAASENAALLISLSIAVALACGWWRRESMHSARYDKLQADRMSREDTLLQCLKQREEELAAMSKEAFEVLRDVSSALAGMERTLESVDSLVRAVIGNRLQEKDVKS
jgi:hypothetical protein